MQISNPTSEGGANKTALADAQVAILRKIPIEIQSCQGHTRSNSWRPLRPDEIAAANLTKARQHWHSVAAAADGRRRIQTSSSSPWRNGSTAESPENYRVTRTCAVWS